jgi:[ribosomal protein S5]-alanine N-acetyltransferase
MEAAIITLIKRDYLEHHDIGFAFLPQYENRGYDYEAAHAVLKQLLNYAHHSTFLATTIPENTKPIQLLEKLGMRFEKEIIENSKRLCVHKIDNK